MNIENQLSAFSYQPSVKTCNARRGIQLRADSLLNKNAPARAEASGRWLRATLLIFRLLLRFQGFDHDELAHRAFVHELDASTDFGEESVVFAAADVEAGLYARAPLAHDDGAARDNLSAESFEA
jgi:hypothetical protein